MKNLFNQGVKSQVSLDQKNLIGLSLLLMMALHFTFGYLAFTYYPENILDFDSPGFWINMLSYAVIAGIVWLNKWVLHWDWSELGLAKPRTWWKPLLVTIAVFAVTALFAVFVQPFIIAEFGTHQNINHLYTLEGNLPKLILSLIITWITAAFLEEVVFRGFFINSLDVLLGESIWSAIGAVVLSALVFGSIHAYQGITGILITTSVGIIFGIAFLLNGRRIWPLVLVHGLFDTIALIGFYNP